MIVFLRSSLLTEESGDRQYIRFLLLSLLNSIIFRILLEIRQIICYYFMKFQAKTQGGFAEQLNLLLNEQVLG